MATTDTPRESETPLAGGTRVLNTQDGESGWIVNGFTFDSDQRGWTEYEVETEYGIERWQRTDFILFSEFEND